MLYSPQPRNSSLATPVASMFSIISDIILIMVLFCLTRVTGSRCYSWQGGLEVPCVLRFEGDDKRIAKAKKLIECTLATETVDFLASKKR